MKQKRFWILIGIGSLLVIFFILLSNILDVGEKLGRISEYLEYAFYGISVLLVYFLIINPLRVIIFAPTFSVEAILDDEKMRNSVYKDAAKVLLKNPNISDGDKSRLANSLKTNKNVREELKEIFNTTIKDQINQIIIKNSKTVLISTALSQNGNLDMMSVVATNIKMIKEIVETTGFRTSYTKLGKLSLNVLVTALIAEGIEDIEMSELLPNKITETITDVPFLKTITSSIMGGISNSILTCRIGVITRTYLYEDTQLLSKIEIRRMAYTETIKMMPKIIADGLAFFPKGITSFLTRGFRKQNKKDESEE